MPVPADTPSHYRQDRLRQLRAFCFTAEAYRLVEAIDGLAERFGEGNRPLDSGRLDIGAGESSTLYLLPPILEPFMAEHPHVEVRLHHLSVGELMEALRHRGK